MTWEPNYRQEFNRRIKIRNRLLDDEKLQRSYQRHYAANPIDWFDDWAITFDPRPKPPQPRLLPFLLFPRQREWINFTLNCMSDKESGLTEKCRDMGVTWEACDLSAYLWLYIGGTQIGFGSRKAEYVDKMGDLKAIFPKIRLQLNHLPGWMLPPGFSMMNDATYMRIINRNNLSAIIGEAGDSMGRGGRTSIYFKDESAHYENPESIEAALGDNTDVQMDISSVNGSANVFYRRRMSGELWYPDKPSTPGATRVFIFDWRDNPMKTQEWYERRKAKAEREGLLHIFAQEVDRDYAGSVERIIIRAEWARAAIDAHIKLGFSAAGAKIGAQDVADGGADKNALAIVHGVIVRYTECGGGEAGDAARAAIPICIEQGCYELYYDSVGVGSGFKTEINNMKEKTMDKEGDIHFPVRVYPWNGGGAVLDPEEHIIPGDVESPTNEMQYHNLKAQGYFRLRSRFYKTWRAVTFGDKYEPEELISLDSTMPRVQELIMELCQPVHKPAAKGKTLVDKKPEGAVSPNMADAVMMAFMPTRQVTIFDSM